MRSPNSRKTCTNVFAVIRIAGCDWSLKSCSFLACDWGSSFDEITKPSIAKYRGHEGCNSFICIDDTSGYRQDTAKNSNVRIYMMAVPVLIYFYTACTSLAIFTYIVRSWNHQPFSLNPPNLII